MTEIVAGVESEPEVFEPGQRGQGHGARIWDIPKVVLYSLDWDEYHGADRPRSISGRTGAI